MADVSPDLFIDAVLAFQQTAAIKAAIELDLFSQVAKGNNTAEGLGKGTGAAVRGIRILCDYLTARGHLEKQGDEYRLTPSTAVFLDRSSPSCISSVVEFLAAGRGRSAFEDCGQGLAGAAGRIQHNSPAGIGEIRHQRGKRRRRRHKDGPPVRQVGVRQ